MSWHIYIFVHFTSTINLSIFSNSLEGRIHFPGDFSELHILLSNLDKFLNVPNTSCSEPGICLVLLLLFILKSREMKSGKKDKQEHLIHSFFTDYAVLFLCFPVPPQEPHCFPKHLLLSHQHSCPIQ